MTRAGSAPVLLVTMLSMMTVAFGAAGSSAVTGCISRADAHRRVRQRGR
jgi:hypothetical protein